MNTSSASLSASESTGFFGAYGGQFVPDDLKARLDEVTEAFDRYSDNSFFKDELDYYFKHYTGRPNPIFFCANLSERLGGAKIYLKREDLNHLGAHKINNTLGQCLLAKRMGKKRIVAETGAGQHGVATAATAALLGLECTVYMGAEDMKRQRLNVIRMEMLGAKVVPALSGQRTLKEAVDEGYDAVKIDPVFAPTDPDTPLEKIWGSQGTQIRGCYRQHDLQRSVERIAACREAGGPDMDIIVEIHSLLDANTAAELGKALEPLHIMYFEEPTSPENPSNFRHIKQKCDLPLATGERSYTRWGFRQFFEDRTLSVIQPDLCNTGGITETKKICDMAQVYDMGVQIHVCGGPIATAAALQLEATIPNFVIHEEHNANLTSAFVKGGKYYYAPKDGYYTVPELPGIGQEMSDFYIANAKKVVIE